MIKKKIKVDFQLYNIVGNGGVSNTSIGEGRLIPVLIIDVEGNTEVIDLFEIHKERLPGDTKLTWSAPPSLLPTKVIYLTLEFSQPMRTSFGVEFVLSRHYSLIDGIIQSRAVYIIAGKVGDKISDNVSNGILVEIPYMKFDAKWNEILSNEIVKQYRRKGASKNEAKAFTKEHISSMRDVWNIRRQ